MKQVILATLTASAVATLSAWTEAETNAVGGALAELTTLSSGGDEPPLPPDDPAANEPLDEPYPTFESLFNADIACASGWTAAEKRAAFFHYLETVTNLVSDGSFTGNVWHADAAFAFCRMKGCAEALPGAIGVLVSPNMPPSTALEASHIFGMFAVPSEQINMVVASMTANTNCLKGLHSRANIYADYCGKLAQAYDLGHTNLARTGASILYRNLRGHDGAKALDVLLLKTFQRYSTSSNRLHLAQIALASDPNEEWTGGYFANITNLLMNAAQPLPAVDGL